VASSAGLGVEQNGGEREMVGARVSARGLQRQRGRERQGGERMRMRVERERGSPGRLLVLVRRQQEVATARLTSWTRSSLAVHEEDKKICKIALGL
jgi:hypothetical protein